MLKAPSTVDLSFCRITLKIITSFVFLSTKRAQTFVRALLIDNFLFIIPELYIFYQHHHYRYRAEFFNLIKTTQMTELPIEKTCETTLVQPCHSMLQSLHGITAFTFPRNVAFWQSQKIKFRIHSTHTKISHFRYRSSVLYAPSTAIL